MRKTLFFIFFILCLQGLQAQKISKTELKDKIAGAWLGQMVGNIYGLPHENKYVDQPAPESRFPFGYTKNLAKLEKYNGAFSDDDTDMEYIYLVTMENYGVEPTYAQMRDMWMAHVRDRVWLANRAAVGLMHYGFTPPFTGDKLYNPHWYQIDPQLINEIWGYTAPGMVHYAAEKSRWAARITSDSWAISPTVLYGAMFAKAFFCKDVKQLIKEGVKELPKDDRFTQGVLKAIRLHEQYPNDWVKVRQIMAKEFYTDENPMTKTIWNADLNGIMGVLAMLYGNNDFQRTLDLACALGFDCDNQAATISGLMAVIHGASWLPKNLTMPIKGWTKPFNDRYINITRYDMPDASIEDMIERTYNQALKVIVKNGGKVKGDYVYINSKATFTPPMEFSVGPAPILEIGEKSDYSFACVTNAMYDWKMVGGKLPSGIAFDKGKLTGTPWETGSFPVTLELSSKGKAIKKDFTILVKPKNFAQTADTIFANIRRLNKAVLDSCWITFGQPMYADSVDIINDGAVRGEGSVFYSLAAKSNLPKVDYFGYGWKEPKTIGMLQLNMGCLEEFGGWFSSLNIQYLGDDNHWYDVGKFSSIPDLPKTDIVFFQPQFAQYVFQFHPVKTRGIRILFDDKVQGHWNKYTKHVSSFISITELGVYE